MLYFINKSNLSRFFLKLFSSRRIFGLKPADGGQYLWSEFTSLDVDNLDIGKYRAMEPAKMFFFPSSEILSSKNTSGDKKSVSPGLHDDDTARPIVIAGLKSCDMRLFHTADNIFLGGVAEDDFYKQKRSPSVLITSDCTDARPGCFCTKMGLNPWPEKNFDINLSPIGDGYVAECGSNIGEDLVKQSPNLFQKAIDQQIREREKNRRAIYEKVSSQNSRFTWKEPGKILEDTFLAEIWKTDIARTCVECDGCRWACGSCYCFLLGETDNFWDKIRTWDSCQSTGYARVAGGANPRREKYQRLRNYYMCKLVYRPKNFSLPACSGCGRCIETCPGKIDIRESLQKLFDSVKNT